MDNSRNPFNGITKDNFFSKKKKLSGTLRGPTKLKATHAKALLHFSYRLFHSNLTVSILVQLRNQQLCFIVLKLLYFPPT